MNSNNLPKNVYYDANIVNNDQLDKTKPPQLIFQDIRSTPILTYPELYEMSVVRFNLETAHSLPLWIPNIQIEQAMYDPNLTSYSFTLTYDFNGSNYSSEQVFVIYIPTDLSAPIPLATSKEETHIPYYYIKSFNTIVEMFNNCLAEAFQRLNNSCSFFGVDLPSQNPPFFEWSSQDSKFILNADVVAFDSSEPLHISIYTNTALYTLMSGFQAFYYGPDLSGKNYKFKITKDIRELNLFKIDDTYSVIQLYQEYSSGALFSPISSIVFTTSMIPVQPSNSTTPLIYNGTGSLVTTGNNITSMITDFQSQDNNGYGYCGSLSYVPTAEYRFISLNQGASHKLSNIDLMVFWKDAYANLHPIYLYSGMTCNIKILFRKINNNEY
jgi:hypothetical protein